MVNQPATPNRNFRCDDDRWERGQRIAEDRGFATMTEYLLWLMDRDARSYPLGD